MKINEKYEVLTPDGWKDFTGVQLKGNKETVALTFDDGTTIRATADHIFYKPNNVKITTGELSIGDKVMTIDGVITLVESKIYGDESVYDLVEVIDSEHQYIVQSKIITKNCDEFAFVRPSLASEFWTSIQPVLSTGGGCIITSTPKNDEDQFAQIWRGSNDNLDDFGNVLPNGVGRNGFFPIKVTWDAHPERDEAWAAPFRASLGLARFGQEMECEFITDDETLIDPMTLLTLKPSDPEFYTGQVRWFREPEANKSFLVALDPSLGTGGDFSAIQVFQVPEMVQVAEWQHNKTAPRGQIKVLLQTLLMLNQTLRENPEQVGDPALYWTVENNSIGEAVLQIIEDTGEHNFPGVFISEKRKGGVSRGRFRKGLNTDNRKKLYACSKMKSLMESNRMVVNSQPLIKQLKNFVSHGASYAAKSGEHDDLVSACLLIVRMLETVINWLVESDSNDLKEIVDPEDEYSEPLAIM